MWKELADFIESHQAPCLIKSLTGHECPGCGSQRAFLLLLRGDFWLSFQVWPALFPLLASFLFIGLHLIFNFRNGGKIILYLLLFTILMSTVSFLIKFVV